MTRPATCARRGCKKELPPIAIREGDPFCSAECCRDHHGVEPMPDVKTTCKGCGCALDKFTKGCQSCKARRVHREYRDRKKAAEFEERQKVAA